MPVSDINKSWAAMSWLPCKPWWQERMSMPARWQHVSSARAPPHLASIGLCEWIHFCSSYSICLHVARGNHLSWMGEELSTGEQGKKIIQLTSLVKTYYLFKRTDGWIICFFHYCALSSRLPWIHLNNEDEWRTSLSMSVIEIYDLELFGPHIY